MSVRILEVFSLEILGIPEVFSLEIVAIPEVFSLEIFGIPEVFSLEILGIPEVFSLVILEIPEVFSDSRSFLLGDIRDSISIGIREVFSLKKEVQRCCLKSRDMRGLDNKISLDNY